MKIAVCNDKVAHCDGHVTDQTGGFWNVKEVLNGDRYLCWKVRTRPFFRGAPLLPWDKVGVYR